MAKTNIPKIPTYEEIKEVKLDKSESTESELVSDSDSGSDSDKSPEENSEGAESYETESGFD